MRIYKLSGFVLLAGLLNSCQLEAPEIPAEELYLRGFIEEFGLVSPTEDFNCARNTDIKLNIPDVADEVNVYTLVGDYYYRVAYYCDLTGDVSIPIDIPEGVSEIMVDVDGAIYHAEPGSTIEVRNTNPVVSRAEVYKPEWKTLSTTALEINTSGVLADAGTFTESTVKYFDLSTTADVTSGLVVEQNKISGTQLNSQAYFKLVNNYETPSTYTFNFNAASRNVATINVSIIDEGGYLFLSENINLRKLSTDIPANGEGLEFTTRLMPKGTYEVVISVIDVPHDPDGYQTGGNWGFFTIKKSQEVKDMAWLMVAEDLGATDDFDFNDIIIRIEAVNLNNVAVERLGLKRWQVIEDNVQATLHAPSRYESGDVTKLQITAMCAGGTLPLWLHYKESDGTDYIIKPNCDEGTSKIVASKTGVDDYEWHRWFGIANVSQMINTGISAHLDGYTSTLLVTGYSMARYSFIDYDGTLDTFGDDGSWSGLVAKWNYFTSNANACINGFYITVREPLIADADSHISALPAGIPPQMFLIPDCSPTEASGYTRHYGWEWPTERTDIRDVYPKFTDWVNGKPLQEGNTTMLQDAWFLNPEAGIVDDDMLRYSRDPNHSSAGRLNVDDEPATTK